MKGSLPIVESALYFIGDLGASYTDNDEIIDVYIRLKKKEYKGLLKKEECIFIQQGGGYIPFFLEYLSIKGGRAMIKLNGLFDDKSHVHLLGCKVFVSKTSIDPNIKLSEDDFEFDGFQLIDQNKKIYGFIQSVENFSGNVLLGLEIAGEYILVPFARELVIEINPKKKILQLQIPEGLLEL